MIQVKDAELTTICITIVLQQISQLIYGYRIKIMLKV